MHESGAGSKYNNLNNLMIINRYSFFVKMIYLYFFCFFFLLFSELKIILMHFTVFINVNEIIFSSSIFWITIIFTASVVLLLDIVVITLVY